jgi:hypothetical protein
MTNICHCETLTGSVGANVGSCVGLGVGASVGIGLVGDEDGPFVGGFVGCSEEEHK